MPRLALGKTKRGETEARDASLALGKTKRGCSVGQGGGKRSGGCLANARQDKKGRSAGQRGVARQDKMGWKGIVTPNIVKGLTWGFLLFDQNEKRNGRKKEGDRPPLP